MERSGPALAVGAPDERGPSLGPVVWMTSKFVMLMLVFTLFELLSDIIRNRTPLVTVGEYLINLTPSMIYTITPLGVLVAVLITFGISPEPTN